MREFRARQIGDRTGTLYSFERGERDELYILNLTGKSLVEDDEWEIVQIEYITADSN